MKKKDNFVYILVTLDFTTCLCYSKTFLFKESAPGVVFEAFTQAVSHRLLSKSLLPDLPYSFAISKNF